MVDAIAAGGEIQTTTGQRVFWCTMEGVVAGCLLLAGGLGALQSATVISALPFTVVMLALVVSLVIGMRADIAQQLAHAQRHHSPPAHPAAGLTWQRRLGLILHAPGEAEVRRFIASEVRPALEQVASELSTRGRAAQVAEEAGGAVALRSPAEGVRDFIYGVSLASHRIASFTPIRAGQPEFRIEARTYFSSGSRGYDVMGMTRDQLISDVLVQFERYLHTVTSPELQLVHGAPEHEPGS